MTRFGPYEVLRRLGSGGNAEVFLATGPNDANAELVALKIVFAHLAQEPRVRESLLQEARHSALLKHRNIVQVYEVGEHEGRPYLLMEYVQGWSLSQVLKKLQEKSQQLTLQEACAIAREVLLGLHFAHEVRDERGRAIGLVHRDVSPQNVMLRQDGRVKVVDFGLAKATLASHTVTGNMKGKLAYMPPEQIEGGPIDRRIDVFAAGALLWELITGDKLYPGKTEAEILQQAVMQPLPDLMRLWPGLPAHLVDVLYRAIARAAKDRYPTALAFADALKPWAAFDSIEKLALRMERLFDRPPDTKRKPGDSKRIERIEVEPPRRALPNADKTVMEAPAFELPTAPKPEKARRAPAVAARPKLKKEGAVQNRRFATTGEVSIRVLLARTGTSRSRRVLLTLAGIIAVVGLFGLGLVAAQRVPHAAPPTDAPKTEAPPQVPTADREPSVPTRSHREHEGRTRAEDGAPRPGGEGTLVLRSDVPAFVKDGRRDLGMTPLTVALSSGSHHLVVKAADGSKSQRVSVNVKPGEQTVWDVKLAQ